MLRGLMRLVLTSPVPFIPIETDRLVVRPVQKADAPFLHKCVYSDPDIMGLFRYGRPNTQEESAQYIDNAVQLWERGSHFGTFAVVDKNSNDILGEISFQETSVPGEAEISYLFAKKAHGKGIAKESVKAIGLQYAFELFKNKRLCNGKALDTIMATVHPDNVASEAIIKNTLGMEFCSEIEKFDSQRRVYSKRLI